MNRKSTTKKTMNMTPAELTQAITELNQAVDAVRQFNRKTKPAQDEHNRHLLIMAGILLLMWSALTVSLAVTIARSH
jgi:hypothetical protein